jgi:hypothetical protein
MLETASVCPVPGIRRVNATNNGNPECCVKKYIRLSVRPRDFLAIDRDKEISGRK